MHLRDGNRILKVNHAGEHGAVNVYAGQLAVARWRARAMTAELAEFKEHEERHRAVFAGELARRGVRRCRTYWLCGAGGFVLGVLTGVLGERAMATTTVAVERVVLGHLDRQLRDLDRLDPDAVTAIAAIVHDERDRDRDLAGNEGMSLVPEQRPTHIHRVASGATTPHAHASVRDCPALEAGPALLRIVRFREPIVHLRQKIVRFRTRVVCSRAQIVRKRAQSYT